ncbi:hypothetical protein CCZ01_09820, partial [Helicobacter monodelphidis]
KYHPEVVSEIPQIIQEGKILKDDKGRLNIEYGNNIIELRNNWQGEETENQWIITSYTKKR